MEGKIGIVYSPEFCASLVPRNKSDKCFDWTKFRL